ncbi:Methylated-DNA--(protein)-cysteine S-methyltransferase [Shewanella sediminis HAW-EB3]|uniref:Methylated-DNA--protein-cysteine methyltransferase n=1 Tax=Shewanella sediminis (strain HAW-EB3) TaxID=425104 RepID=A8FXD7_SHESH|nr:methylated-DNA--[protein]-cysteine S-methyltransferase [Shewanella sediminis]ABV37510.1 Methylated-DNA--(protein)-cysteine S-methyltransferase [Shewanella sediminis HAW-EB3]
MTIINNTNTGLRPTQNHSSTQGAGSLLVSLPCKDKVVPLASKTFATPVGQLLIKANQYGLSHLRLAEVEEVLWVDESHPSHLEALGYLSQTELELGEYFSGTRETFSVSLAPQGTEFQRQVWQALLEIKHGEYCSYSDIAQQINRPKAVRAVGAANGANRIAIIIPCHRVIGKNGKLTGYAYGIEMKRQLLGLEGNVDQKTIMF